MSRPPTTSPARPRATAHSFPRPTSNLEMPYLNPTPPYSSEEDGIYSQPHLMPPPTIVPQHMMNQGMYFLPTQYHPPASEVIPRQPSAPPPVTPTPPQLDLPSESQAGPSKSLKNHTPRPPNAWILYRSDMLKTIASGGEIPGLESVMAELGVSGSSESSGEGEVAGSKRKTKKGKKGAKEPTEGLLSLGRGKTGRGLPQADISKMISMLWKRETPKIRGEYEKRSEMKKQEHALLYPDYKFQPLRKADKMKQREEKEREREAARREKELQKSGGRRRAKNRNRHSPPTPYSILDDGTRMAKSLTYSGEDTPTESYDRFRSYPFPMPQSSLPSMGPEQLGVPYDASFVNSYPPPKGPITAPPSQPISVYNSPRNSPPRAHDMASLWSEIDQPQHDTTSPHQIISESQAVKDLVEDGVTLPYIEPDYTFAEVELRHLQPTTYDAGWVQQGPEYTFAPLSPGAVYDGNVYETVPAEEIAWNDAVFDFSTEAPLIIGDPNGPLVPMEAVFVEEGPFLYESAVFSPDPNVSEDHMSLPRHVSSSAFPITPQSESYSLPVNWNDRATSFAFANTFTAPLGMEFTADDVLNWEDPSSPINTQARSRTDESGKGSAPYSRTVSGNVGEQSEYLSEHKI